MKKIESHGCGVAAVAMVAGLTYKQSLSFFKSNSYEDDGVWTGHVLSALRKATRSKKWKLQTHTVAVPFRLWTPKVQRGVILMMRPLPSGNSYSHFVAYENGRLFDPDEPRSVSLTSAKHQKIWRPWLIIAEIGQIDRNVRNSG